jgi:uncharacterized iron-regulated membrane protein
MKHFISKAHLYLGLISAPIVFFICLTGTIIVFCDEIIEWSAGDARYVEHIKPNKLPVKQLLSTLHDQFPERRTPNYLVSYQDPKRSIRFNSYDPQKGLRMVYVDPYTGKILKDDSTIHFFYITAHLHNSFLLGKPGEWVVKISVLLFVISLFTGLVIWWPKMRNKNSRKAAFTIKLNAPFRRLNYDLHKVLGFYGFGISLLLAATGLIIAFQPLSNLTLNAFGGDSSQILPKNETTTNKKAIPMNSVIEKAFKCYPEKHEVQVYTYNLNKSAYYILNVAKQIGIKSARSNQLLIFNKSTGKEIQISKELLQNERIKNTYWTLHMGNWMGLTGKIITFIGGLISTILPISGIYIWWQSYRRRKQNRITLN